VFCKIEVIINEAKKKKEKKKKKKEKEDERDIKQGEEQRNQ
jgi:hypothetical protein